MAEADMHSLRQLVEERGRLKAALASLKTFCDTRGATESITALQSRLDSYLPIIEKCTAIHDRTMAIVSGTPEEEAHEQYFCEFEDSYHQIAGAIRDHIRRAQAPANRRAKLACCIRFTN